MTTQHLRDLTQPRRAATVVVAVLRLGTELTDAVLLSDLARRAEPDQKRH